jgi:hypothetical protein
VITSDKYRFTLQWTAETDAKVQAGDLLESLGNKKSEFVVLAVTEYITAHPDALLPGNQKNLISKPGYSRKLLESLIRAIIDEKFAGTPPVRENIGAEDMSAIESDVDEMLMNIDLF